MDDRPRPIRLAVPIFLGRVGFLAPTLIQSISDRLEWRGVVLEITLRPYQHNDINRLRRSFSSGKRAPLYVLPTGGGKTFTFTFIAKSAVAKGKRVLIVVHRQELLAQASRSLKSLGVDHGIIAPGYYGERLPIAVGSIQTIDRRLSKTPFDYDLVIVDEAHHSVSPTWARVLSQFPRSSILGVTATPVRTDGQGLGVEAGGLFDDLIIGPSIQELIDGGSLVKPIVYAPPVDLDLTGVRRSKGDFSSSQLAERVDKPGITGSAVEHYRKLCPGEPAIAFCVSINHAIHVADEFNAAGFKFKVIHGKLEDSERKQMIDDLASGKIDGLTSVDLISEGTDIPVVSAAILLRPTQSLSLYIQQVGRVLRPSASKARAIILDHVGNCLKHGLPYETREWSLEGIKRKSGKRDDVTVVKQCKRCFAVWETGIICPECGSVNPGKPRKLEEREGHLKEITESEIAERRSKRQQEGMARTFEDFLNIQKQRGYSNGWAKHRWDARQRKMKG